MKKQLIILGTLAMSPLALGQVGINNVDPKATLDISAKTTNGSKPEGIIAPRLTGDQIKAGDALYTSAQTGTIIYASSPVTTASSKTANITSAGYYYFNGTSWQTMTGSGSSAAYTGSTSVNLNGTSFERAALTGDVTAGVNTNATTIAANAVTSAKIADGTVVAADMADGSVTTAKILDGTILTADIANSAVTSAKIQGSTTNGQVLTTNASGVTSWVTPVDNNTTYIAGTGLALSGTTFSATDASTTAKGIVQLSGDLAGTAALPTVAKIQNRSVSATVPTNGQVLKYNTTTAAWEPAADSDTNTSYTGSTSVALNGTSFERAALTGDVTAGVNTNATTISANAVTSAKIADGTIVAADMADSSVTTTKIVDGTIITADIANSAVTSAKIQGSTTNGQVLTTNASGVTSWVTPTTGITSEVDGIIGNEITSASLNGGLMRAGAGTAASPYTLGLTTGTAANQVMKWNGTAWAPGTDDNTNTLYTGSTSVNLNGTSFERAALTGDVTAGVNTNATTIAANAVTSAKIADGTVVAADMADGSVTTAKILDGTILTADIANSAVTSAKIQGSTTNGQVLTTNASGVTSWSTPVDNNTTYAAGTGLALSGTTFSATDASTTAKGIVQLSGDLAGTAALPTVAKIQNRTVAATAPVNGQVLKYNTTTAAWEPAADNGINYTSSTSVALNGTAIERAALTGDVTAGANSNATTVAGIRGRTISTAAPTNGQVLKYNTTTAAWEPAADSDTNTSYTGSTSVALNGTSFERAALTGDVTAGVNTNATTISANAVTSAKIADGTIVAADMANNAVTVAKLPAGATSTTFLKGDGTWAAPIEAVTVSPEVTTGTYTVKPTDFYLRLNPTAAQINVNLPSTAGIPVGRVIYITNKGNYQVNFIHDGVALTGTQFYNTQTPNYVSPGYNAILIYLGGSGPGAWNLMAMTF